MKKRNLVNANTMAWKTEQYTKIHLHYSWHLWRNFCYLTGPNKALNEVVHGAETSQPKMLTNWYSFQIIKEIDKALQKHL